MGFPLLALAPKPDVDSRCFFILLRRFWQTSYHYIEKDAYALINDCFHDLDGGYFALNGPTNTINFELTYNAINGSRCSQI